MRIKTGPTRARKHREIRKKAKGFRGHRGRSVRGAKEGLLNALSHAYVSRKLKKRNMKRLWIQRINAALRQNGTTYNNFFHQLRNTEIKLNRKVLSEIAMHDPETFGKIVDKVSNAK